MEPRLEKNWIDPAIIGGKIMKGLNQAWQTKNKASDALSFENKKSRVSVMN